MNFKDVLYGKIQKILLLKILMSDQDNNQNKINELRSIYKYYIDSYNSLYQLKTENEEELNSIYKILKSELIDSKKYLPQNIIKDILNIIPYNNRYAKSYLTLMKLITNDYHLTEASNVPIICNIESLDIQSDNTIYRAIMNNDLKAFISFTEKEEFDIKQQLISDLYPKSNKGYSLLELCCYHGAVDCFKFLRTAMSKIFVFRTKSRDHE